MDFKQVYLYDGTPYIAFVNDEDGEYDYPEEAWTEVAPPEGIYSPFYFNGNEWVGVTHEEWESNNIGNDIDYEPTKAELESAKTQMELFKAQLSIEQLRQDNANIIKEIVLLKGGN